VQSDGGFIGEAPNRFCRQTRKKKQRLQIGKQRPRNTTRLPIHMIAQNHCVAAKETAPPPGLQAKLQLFLSNSPSSGQPHRNNERGDWKHAANHRHSDRFRLARSQPPKCDRVRLAVHGCGLKYCIANTSTGMAWIGNQPVHTLAAVTSLNESDLNAMMAACFQSPRSLSGVVGPDDVSGKKQLKFCLQSWCWAFLRCDAVVLANHMDSNLVDISAGRCFPICNVAFLRVWRPKTIWRFADEPAVMPVRQGVPSSIIASTNCQSGMPFAILSIFVFLLGTSVNQDRA